MRTRKGDSPRNFHPSLLWPNSWMDQDAAWYRGMKVVLGPGRIVTWDPARPPESGTDPHFSAMSIVAKRSPISATVEHLFKCDVDHDIPLQIVWTGSGSVPDGCGRPKVISA